MTTCKLACILFFICPQHNAFAQQPKVTVLEKNLLFQTDQFFQQCHASTLVETQDGNMLSSWFAGSHEGNKDVHIWGSIKQHGKWSQPSIWADGKLSDTLQYPCWNPVLFKAKQDKRIYLYYKVGPNPREWWGMVKTSDDGGITWSAAQNLEKGVLGPIKNKPVELDNGDILSPSSMELSEDIWRVHLERSTDKQRSWSIIPVNHHAPNNVIQPSILQHTSQRLQILCRSKEAVVISAFSNDQGKTWSEFTKTNLLNPNSATDAVRIGKYFMIAYNPDIPGKDWWEGRAKLRLAYSEDGLFWKDILTLEDHSKGEYSYPSLFLDKKGILHLSYTADRKNIQYVRLKFTP